MDLRRTAAPTSSAGRNRPPGAVFQFYVEMTDTTVIYKAAISQPPNAHRRPLPAPSIAATASERRRRLLAGRTGARRSRTRVFGRQGDHNGHAEHLVAVLRETLSNAARHAHATAVEVTAETDGSRLRLRVADNGSGIDPAVTRRSGLDNLSRRAADLGGSFTLTPNQPTGTLAEWTVPLPAQAPA